MRRNRTPMAVLELPEAERADIAAGIVWSKFLDEHLSRFERTVGVPVGKLLGCGLFGCVFESSPPWVVKFTRDETEGPIWAYMAELLLDPEITGELNGFLRVADVVRIRPDVIFAGEEMPVFGIVREEAVPVLKGDPDLASDETLRRLGVTDRMLAVMGLSRDEPSLNRLADKAIALPAPVRSALRELFIVLMSLREYRKHALVFHEWRGRLIHHAYAGLSQDEAESVADEAFRQMLDAIEVMRGSTYTNRFGDDIGKTLQAAVNFGDLVFRDLHLMNVGWRVHETIDGDTRPPCMVILDPGAMATPYSPEVREAELLENMARYVRNFGGA